MDRETFMLEQVRRDERIAASEVASAKALLAVAEARYAKAKFILEVSESGHKARMRTPRMPNPTAIAPSGKES
jgi:hypothetical protein